MTDSSHTLPIGTQRMWHGVTITLTEEGWRASVQHSMHRRCKGWDYCKPWIYMITIDTQHHDTPPMPVDEQGHVLMVPDHESQTGSPLVPYHLPEWLVRTYKKKGHPHLFGELAEEVREDGKPFIRLNAFGMAVEKEILGIPAYYPQLRILEHVVMPNHIHIVVQVKERLPEKKPLGFVLNKFKSGVNRRFKEIVLGLPASTYMHVEQPVASVPSKSFQPRAERTRREAESTRTGRGEIRGAMDGHGSKNPKVGLVFEVNFHDRILFREGQLEVMIAYVLDNQRRLWEVINNRKYFEHIENWRITMPLLPGGGTKNTGRWWECHPGGRQALMAEGPKGLLSPIEATAETMSVTFNAIGNRELLRVPERMQIQCSRKMAQTEIDALIEDVLEACKHGVVPVSPCLSPGEKAVARAVMDAGYPLITLFPQGIPPQTDEYKPYGQFFEACRQGQLLILSPWDFSPEKKRITRWQCLMLNDMAAQLMVM